MIAAFLLLQAGHAFGHPGHDHHLPQSGVLHWLLAPAHAIPILAGLGLIVGFALWKLRLLQLSSSSAEIGPNKN